ncbi:MAG: aldo/keto reductase [Verrucomicrobiae bacterium]|nr:aldo/keto reductase [Verrucomicrobiae bacterium]
MKTEALTRRQFVRALGISAAGALAVARTGMTQEQQQNQSSGTAKPGKIKVPTRRLGKTGVDVSILSLGGIFDITSNQLVLQQALDWGVTHWDTAPGYTGGKSEEGIGMFFEKNPEARKKVFLVTKARPGPLQSITDQLNQSLERMKTDYVDLYFLHAISSPTGLTDEIKDWAEKAKAEKKIRFFGFSTHQNMEECLQGAAKLGWIDAIMLTYNYRVMHTDAMKAAVEAASKAGIGLVAMKTQGRRTRSADEAAEVKLIEHFIQRGFTAEQARLKVVWENPQIASICSAMYTISTLAANVAAAIDKTELTAQDRAALAQAAAETCSTYCAGCTRYCEAAINFAAPVGDIMRSLMYYHSYGDYAYAREIFESIPAQARMQLTKFDYSPAERVCPNRLPITELVREATRLLA